VSNGAKRARGLLTQPLNRFRKTYLLGHHRQSLEPVHQAFATTPRVAAAGPGPPATRLAAQTPELKQRGGEPQIPARIGGTQLCFLHSSSARHTGESRYPVKSNKPSARGDRAILALDTGFRRYDEREVGPEWPLSMHFDLPAKRVRTGGKA